MVCHCLSYHRFIFVGIAVATAMAAGIISPNITADQARAAWAYRSLRSRNGELQTKGMFQNSLRHTAGAVEAKMRKIISL